MFLSIIKKAWCGVKTLVYTCYVGTGIAAAYCFVKAVPLLIDMFGKLETAFLSLTNLV